MHQEARLDQIHIARHGVALSIDDISQDGMFHVPKYMECCFPGGAMLTFRDEATQDFANKDNVLTQVHELVKLWLGGVRVEQAEQGCMHDDRARAIVMLVV